MEDYLAQLKQMKKMGCIEGIMSFMPGVSKMKSQMDAAGINEKIITTNEENGWDRGYYVFSARCFKN